MAMRIKKSPHRPGIGRLGKRNKLGVKIKSRKNGSRIHRGNLELDVLIVV
jgi:hypothetical protein